MIEITIFFLFAMICFGINEGIKWYVSDDRQLPLSYWSHDQIDAAFARSPMDRKKFEERGTMSRNEWLHLMARRDREIVAELKRRGVDPNLNMKKDKN